MPTHTRGIARLSQRAAILILAGIQPFELKRNERKREKRGRRIEGLGREIGMHPEQLTLAVEQLVREALGVGLRTKPLIGGGSGSREANGGIRNRHTPTQEFKNSY